jgi:hypothetical protein
VLLLEVAHDLVPLHARRHPKDVKELDAARILSLEMI